MTLPTFETLGLALQDHIATVRLNRPEKANAMNATMWQEIRQAFRWVDETPEARVAVLQAEGKYFTAGIDLQMMMGLQAQIKDDCDGRSREKLRALVLELQDTLSSIERCRKPVLAAIHGGCVGGGVDLISCTDMRYCSADAYFTIKEIDIGMVADVGTLQRLPKLIPMGVVKELAYTGRRMPAQKALGYGLVNEVFETPEAMLAAALQCAQEIASKPPVAIWGTKQAVNYARDHSVDDSLRQMGWLQGAIWSNQHVRESVTAMKQKRTGDFPALAALTRFSEQG